MALEAHAEHVELIVEDTGTGIPRDELPSLFRRFHRVRGARARSHEGSGIGLALVQELATLHGGAVRVESRLGQGSTFSVTIPRGRAHLPAAAESAVSSSPPPPLEGVRSQQRTATSYLEEASSWQPAQAEDEGLAGALRAGRPRVLVVDDNADLRSYVRGLLEDAYAVETAVDGQEGLAAVQSRPPDLVVSDVMMPRLDGFGLLRALREDPATCDIPVILLSARAGEELTVEGLEAGADDYLVKPFSARELRARVASCLELTRMRRVTVAQQEAIRVRNEFLTLASHELRTPLTPLQLQVQLAQRHLAKHARSADSAAWLGARLEAISRHLERLGRTVSGLLDVSSIARGELELRPEPTDLVEVVREVVECFEARGDVAQSGSVVRVAADGAVVGQWDRRRLEQIVAQLLANALRYGGGEPIELEVSSQDAVGLLRVRDRGIGIAPEAHERIFGRFEQAVTVRHLGGWGSGCTSRAALPRRWGVRSGSSRRSARARPLRWCCLRWRRWRQRSVREARPAPRRAPVQGSEIVVEALQRDAGAGPEAGGV